MRAEINKQYLKENKIYDKVKSYEPNVPLAKKRLEPLGVDVFHIKEKDDLPFKDDTFELVINRHEYYSEKDVFRVLKL